ncbi:MAG: hypothetical protein ABIA04_13780 [Pseudomonadota bacterium]
MKRFHLLFLFLAFSFNIYGSDLIKVNASGRGKIQKYNYALAFKEAVRDGIQQGVLISLESFLAKEVIKDNEELIKKQLAPIQTEIVESYRIESKEQGNDLVVVNLHVICKKDPILRFLDQLGFYFRNSNNPKIMLMIATKKKFAEDFKYFSFDSTNKDPVISSFQKKLESRLEKTSLRVVKYNDCEYEFSINNELDFPRDDMDRIIKACKLDFILIGKYSEQSSKGIYSALLEFSVLSKDETKKEIPVKVNGKFDTYSDEEFETYLNDIYLAAVNRIKLFLNKKADSGDEIEIGLYGASDFKQVDMFREYLQKSAFGIRSAKLSKTEKRLFIFTVSLASDITSVINKNIEIDLENYSVNFLDQSENRIDYIIKKKEIR